MDERARSIEQYLQALPSARPPSALGDRIVGRQLGKHRRRRRLRAILLVATLAAASLPLWQPVPDAPEMAALAVLDDDASVRQVRALDRKLQASYATHADPAELDRLWQLRHAAMRPLEHPSAGPARLVRL